MHILRPELSKECLAGFTIIEAKDMNEALELVSKFPARLTSVEVRPVMDPLFICVTALLFLIMRRLVRMGAINYLRKETEQ